MSKRSFGWSYASMLVIAGIGCGAALYWSRKRRTRYRRKTCGSSAYEAMIGDTPCVLLPKLSKLVGCEIYVKLESWNPGGTGKDRAAKSMIAAAEAAGFLPSPKILDPTHLDLALQVVSDDLGSSNKSDEDAIIRKAMQRSVTGGLIVEGTSGSTGIALASLAIAKGHACLTVLPDDQASEKQVLLEVLGAVVYIVPTAAIANPQHYVNVAARIAARALELGIMAVFINQFENLANFAVHYETTGPEIWAQCRPDAFVMSAGTGGSIGGVAKYLKEKGKCRVVLVDPVGSVLYSKVEHGVAFTSQQRERGLLRHRYDSIAEGIGLDRVTANLSQSLAFIDTAMIVQDQDAVNMAHFILENEGLLIGSSSAMNLVGAVRTAWQLPAGSSRRVCTVLCDSGQRHVTRFWNRDFICSRGLEWPRDKPNWTREFLANLQADTPTHVG
jgi:cysteine synthase